MTVRKIIIYLSVEALKFKALTDAEKKDQKVMGSYLSLMNEDVNASGVVYRFKYQY